MPTSHVAIFVHLVWATWDRQPLLTPELAPRVQRVVADKAQECGATVLAIGGVEDHLHLLVRLPATVTIATLMKQIKGGSAYFIAHHLAPGSNFRWQGSYGAFSIGRQQIGAVCAYIARQREHHATNAPLVHWEERVLARTRMLGEEAGPLWDAMFKEDWGDDGHVEQEDGGR